MKKTRQCPKCSGTKLGYVEYLPDFVDEPDEDGMKARPRALGLVPVTWEEGLIRKQKKTQQWPQGEFEAYICTTCGYTETYLKKPENINYEQLPGFQWLEPVEAK